MEQANINELGCHVGHHRRPTDPKPDVGLRKSRTVGTGDTSQPKDEDNPAIQQRANPNELIGFALTPDLTNQIGT